MKQLQRTLSLLLAVVMLLTGVYVGGQKAFAASPRAVTETGNYFWKTENGNFQSKTTDGAAYNYATSNWISGRDFTFSYMGCAQFSISNCTMDYLKIHEGKLPTGVVEFRDWDGTVLSSAEYTYGDTVVPPANPSRAQDDTDTYQFVGWDKDVVACAGDAVYTAVYTSEYRNYTVTFVDYDGSVLLRQTYHYGDPVTIPANPTREADDTCTYTFIGWDRSVEACTGDA